MELDNARRIGHNTVFGDAITAERNPSILVQFQYNIADRDVTTTVANGGTVTQTDAMAVMSTSVTSNGSAIMESTKRVRYLPGCEMYAYFTVLWENGGVANATQYAGLFNTTDGYFVGFNGTDFGVGYRRNSTDTFVTQGNFNGNKLEGFDFTKINIFRISLGWLGTAPITFEYCTPDGQWGIMHTFELPNTLTQPHSFNPVLPICFEATKTSGSDDIVMKTASWNAGVAGMESHVSDRYFTGLIGPIAVTSEQVLINFQNMANFQGKTNQVTAEGVRIGISTDGNKNALLKIYKNLPITSPTWTDVDSTNSIMQTDTVGTVTPSDANLLWDYPLAKTDSVIDDISGLDFTIGPGETVTITGQSASTNDITFTARWRELF